MNQQQAAARGVLVEAAYALHVRGPALDMLTALSPDDQACLDESFNLLEWTPWPDEARELKEGVLAVQRCGYWIIYERDDTDRALEVWALLPA